MEAHKYFLGFGRTTRRLGTHRGVVLLTAFLVISSLMMPSVFAGPAKEKDKTNVEPIPGVNPDGSIFLQGRGAGVDTPSEEEARANVRKLLFLMGSDKLAMQVMEQMIGQFKTLLPDIPASFWGEFMKEVDPKELIEIQVPVYLKNLSPADVQELIRFYESPVGQRYSAVMPVITQESMAVGQKWGALMGERIMKRLQEKGYKI